MITEIQEQPIGRFPGYETLTDVLERALQQAAAGKGNDRHAQGQPFHEQPMLRISELLDSDGGMAFQAIKKIQEARRLPTRERRVAELLGAINYIAGMVILEESQIPAGVAE
ncbi:hypothetical protein [Microbulbifer sp. ALW1]|uniref:hypothetical protein n=1 Tax=Microbulbifer sp. (strain ALW1) TaxID=1516059 RepID=UPI00135AC2FD|nr:hypothetical protein [Microbulbifer sp. ALW1]